jgi:hypothetical protein
MTSMPAQAATPRYGDVRRLLSRAREAPLIING